MRGIYPASGNLEPDPNSSCKRQDSSLITERETACSMVGGMFQLGGFCLLILLPLIKVQLQYKITFQIQVQRSELTRVGPLCLPFPSGKQGNLTGRALI